MTNLHGEIRGMKKISIAVFFGVLLAAAARGQSFFLLVGTYTNTGNLSPGAPPLDSTGSKGIYVFRFDAATGEARLLSTTTGVCNPSFLTVAPDGHHVYACTESRMHDAGTVSAFDLERERGVLRFIDKTGSGGDNPAYVSIDGTGKWVAVANYTGGSFVVCPVEEGVLPFKTRVAFTGHGVNPARQEASHVHSAVFSPDFHYLYIQDLGLDRITILSFDEKVGLENKPASVVTTVPGAGPRHLIFGPDGHFAYLIEEMGGCVDVYRYDAGTGGLDSLQRIAAHPDTARDHGTPAAGPSGQTLAFRSADIHVSPDGRFLYASNRAEGTIAIFAIDRTKGTLRTVGYQPVLGKEPRNFMLDPTGSWLLVANQDSGEIVVFRVDRKTGLLKPQPARIKVPVPTCLRMTP